MSGLKEKIAEAISKHVSLEDTYTYELKRVKAAFDVGTMSLEDFEEWTEKNVDDLAKSIVEALQPQLNENQQVVLDWLKERQLEFNERPSTTIYFLTIHYPYGLDDVAKAKKAFSKLNKPEENQVLELFSKWAQEQEEE